MARFVILGAGRQGTACGAYLLEHVLQSQVTFVDSRQEHLASALASQKSAANVTAVCLDLGRDLDGLRRQVTGADCIVSCVPYFLNEPLTDLAIEVGACFCDLGGNKGTVSSQLRRHDRAVSAQVTVVPDSGLAPGLLNVLAEYWKDRWKYRSVRLYCGGLPQQPRGVLKHELTFSIWGLLNEYFDDCEVSRGGKLVSVEGLSEPERLNDLPIAGEFEAFATSGGSSSAAVHYAPLGVDYQYKTIRYPGHRDIYVGMRELGLFDTATREFDVDGTRFSSTPRRVTTTLMDNAVPSNRRDLVVARADVEGECDGRRVRGRIDLLDKADERFTAMERTTGYPTAILAAALTGAYDFKVSSGAYAPFQVIPPALMIRELARSGVTDIRVAESETTSKP